MKKKILFLFILFMYFMLPQFKVNAYLPNEIKNRKECEKIELATALDDGTLAKVECYDSYQLAKDAMNNTLDNDNLVIIENGVIVDSKYGLVDYDIDYTNRKPAYTNLYSTSTSNSTVSYIRPSSVARDSNGNEITGPDDAALIDYDYNAKRAKIKVAGVIGWINEDSYDIVPLAWVKTPQYYNVSDSELRHSFPGNVYNTKKGYSHVIDRKPSMLEKGNYYSYDGHYFYTDLKTMLKDYKNNNYDNAVNKDKPYYNFYQYMPYRTKTTYNADNINKYIENRTGKNSKSIMLNSGEGFINAQNDYGVNAILMMSVGINESATGTSPIAINKNNLFGLNAVDAAPGDSAKKYETVADCISDYAYRWMSYWYLQPGDSHYHGGNLGDKHEGLNYSYASDPFWGEKAAHYYYDLDKLYGFQDYYALHTAVLNNDYSNTVYAYKTVNGEKIRIYDSNNYYQFNLMGVAVSILDKIEGPSVNGSTIWYKIQSEPVLDSNFNYIGDSKSNPRYLYNFDNMYVYVPSSYFYDVTDNTNINVNPNVDPDPNQDPGTTPNEPKSISSILGDSKISVKNNLINNIKLGTDISNIISTIQSNGGVITSDKTTGIVGTGDKITISNGTDSIVYEIVVNGDITGDGVINSADLLRMRQYLLGTDLVGSYKEAAYMGYSDINSANLLKIRQYLLGQINIE